MFVDRQGLARIVLDDDGSILVGMLVVGDDDGGCLDMWLSLSPPENSMWLCLSEQWWRVLLSTCMAPRCLGNAQV